ncbi:MULTISPECIES: Mur ligase family protein [unclassified Ruminococcus]|uniref:Mur ligase family protein n=1 Tax=unclassified Ruminococcus TaxID=2608920 RepID=UPI002109A485|nr:MULTISPECIES: Mur ligase family protein [unclassified Ruminococcus]MCQ4022962.1 DUF1727 domain-containing protein [Ruminococcus sp. zg-924]MCQ4115340.1 DUF1727 domain-containing protein [Ruminococcus sp. zg-921]
MKLFFVILICKLLKFAGSIIGKGSSLPGQIALKLYPNILSKIKLPKYIIAVTGSNGKTSTVEMIATILKKNGRTVAYNKEGSNQIEGVTTLVLSNCTLGGKMNSDILLIESDERYARYTFKYFHPTHYIITNLYRDQLTRNGHPQWVYEALSHSIHDDTQLILNADDPLISRFANGRDNTLWFGVDKLKTSLSYNDGVYNDGVYCPVCGGRMTYGYYHYNHIGSYSCNACGFKRADTNFTVTNADMDKGEITVNGKYTIPLAFTGMYNVYNILAAFAACAIAGIDGAAIAGSIGNYMLKNGRIMRFRLGSHDGTLLTSKHENSVSYDQSLKYIASRDEQCSVIVIVDAISRKYFTGETSWLWDINFDHLNSKNVENIYLTGTYVNDLALRFSFTGIDQSIIKPIADIQQCIDYIKESGSEKLYCVTCFSDKEKLLSRVEVL